MANVVEIEDLHKNYRLGDERIPALRGISLGVAPGQFIAIMGASGSGKTTLMHLIGGLDLPDKGRILVDGENIHALSDEARTLFRRRRLGIVFQAYNLMPSLSAMENIMLPLLVDGMPQRQARARADKLIDMVHLSHRTRHRPATMSGGEQQRAAIARALMNEPAVVLADEPTGNLDPTSAASVWKIFRDLTSDGKTSVIMVTHEADAAAQADIVHVIKEGRITGAIEPKGSGDANLVAARYTQLAD